MRAPVAITNATQGLPATTILRLLLAENVRKVIFVIDIEADLMICTYHNLRPAQ